MTKLTVAFKIRFPIAIASDSQKSNARAWPLKRTVPMPTKPCTTKSNMSSWRKKRIKEDKPIQVNKR